MELSEAKQVLALLADGFDPATGKAFADGSPYQNARVVRALHRALQALGDGQPHVAETPKPERAGEPWSSREDNDLRREYGRGQKPAQLAETHHRTLGAINSRLAKLGLAPSKYDNDAGVSKQEKSKINSLSSQISRDIDRRAGAKSGDPDDWSDIIGFLDKD